MYTGTATGIHTLLEAAKIACAGWTNVHSYAMNNCAVEHTNTEHALSYMRRYSESQYDYDWLYIEPSLSTVPDYWEDMEEFLVANKGRGCRTIVLAWAAREPDDVMATIVKAVELKLQHRLPEWPTMTTAIFNTHCGGPIERVTYICICTSPEVMRHLSQMDLNVQEEATPLRDVLDPPNYKYSDYYGTEETITGVYPPKHIPEEQSKEIGFITVHFKHESDKERDVVDTYPVMSIDHPGPDFARDKSSTRHRHNQDLFLVETYDMGTPRSARPIRRHELMTAMGYDEEAWKLLMQIPWPVVYDSLKKTTPLHTAIRILTCIATAEDMALETEARQAPTPNKAAMYCAPVTKEPSDPQSYALSAPSTRNEIYPTIISQWNTMPVPTTKEWKEALQEDEDTRYMIECISDKTPPNYGILKNKAYYKQWKECHLEVEDGILYQWEMPTRQIRQLRRRVVPTKLRYAVFVAFHATPMAGHVGMHKTYYRILARFWWPGMYSYIVGQVKACAHCVLANNTSHKAQRILKGIETAEPFDIMAFDVWYPGTVTEADIAQKGMSKPKRSKKKGNGQALLTGVCTTTAFAGVALLQDINSNDVQEAVFAQFFIPNGFPRKVLIDEGSEFKGKLVKLFEFLEIPFEVVSPEEHQGILCERFHRYLNKVARIQGLDNENHEEFYLSGLFATYGWNSAPIDGTNIQRSFAAKARTFRFPIDTTLDEEPTVGNPAIRATQHVTDVFPLWRQQNAVLQILREDRREYHRALRNANKKQRVFHPGDIVVVRRQVTSDAQKGKPGKLQMRAKGIYKVLERCSEDSDDYWIQKVQTVATDVPRNYVRSKESASRLERLPATVVVNRRMYTSDQKFLADRIDQTDNPLQDNLGMFDFGKYAQANEDANFAYDLVEDLFEVDLDPEEDLEGLDDNPTPDPIDTDTAGGGTEQQRNTAPTPRITRTVTPTDPNRRRTRSQQEAVPETGITETEPDPTFKPSLQKPKRVKMRVQKKQPTKEGEATTEEYVMEVEDIPDDDPESDDATLTENGLPPVPPQKLKAITKLVKAVDKSIKQGEKHILFFIKQERPNYKLMEWHLVEIDQEAWKHPRFQSRIRKRGRIHIRYWIRNLGDAQSKPTSECKYWPNIHRFKDNGTTLGPMSPMSPRKVEKTLKDYPERYFWYQNTIDLTEALINGPFTFDKGYKVPLKAWKALRQHGKENKDLYIGNLDKVIPLDAADDEYKDATGASYAFMARRFRMPESFNG